MKITNFVRILALTLALSGYSAWVLASRDRPAVAPSSEPWVVADIPLLHDEEAEALWHDPGTLFVDVRPAADYEFGHIAGAVSLPWETIETRLPGLLPRLEQATTLVVYCKSEDCGKSLWSAIRLRQRGLTHTKIYPDGWNEWTTRNHPVARGS